VIVTSVRYTQAVSDQAGITIRIDPTEIVCATGNAPEMRILGNLKLVGIRHCSPGKRHHSQNIPGDDQLSFRPSSSNPNPQNQNGHRYVAVTSPRGASLGHHVTRLRDLATVHFPLTATLFLVLNSGAVPGIACLRYRRDSRYQVRQILSGVPEPSPDPASACAVRHLGRLCAILIHATYSRDRRGSPRHSKVLFP
jgi:hypothetical protein